MLPSKNVEEMELNVIVYIGHHLTQLNDIVILLRRDSHLKQNKGH